MIKKASKVSNKDLSRGYSFSLMRRHPEFESRKSKEVPEDSKAACNVDTMTEFFKTLEDLYKTNNYLPELVVNYDETMVQVLQQKRYVVVPVGEAPVRSSPSKLNVHITLGLFISADGKHFKPMIIVPQKEFPVTGDDATDDFVWSGQNFCSLFAIVSVVGYY